MWYLGFRKDGPTRNFFGHAFSPDGIHWEKHKGNPLSVHINSIIWGAHTKFNTNKHLTFSFIIRTFGHQLTNFVVP